MPDNAGVDSFAILPLLRGERKGALPTHPFVIHHSVQGRFAIRQGKWKFVACKGSGGWSKGNDGEPAQLYDMSTDRGEEHSVVGSRADEAKRRCSLLEKAVAEGRTRPGKPQSTDVEVDIWKTEEGRPSILI